MTCVTESVTDRFNIDYDIVNRFRIKELVNALKAAKFRIVNVQALTYKNILGLLRCCCGLNTLLSVLKKIYLAFLSLILRAFFFVINLYFKFKGELETIF